MTRCDSPTLPDLSRWYGAAAAGALAVGATAAEAQVVYTDIDDVTVENTFESSAGVSGPGFDFDGDGDAEVIIAEVQDGLYTIGGLPITGDGDDQGTGFVGNSIASYGYFLPLQAGVVVGAGNANLRDDDTLPSFTFNGGDPNGFQDAGDVYLGLRISLDDAGTATTHYGWMRVSMPAGGGSLVVKDLAYNATADADITTGDMGAGTAVDPDDLPEGYRFTAVAPNPVAGVSRFDLAVGQPEAVRVEVFDALGRSVDVLHDGPMAGGVARTFELRAGSLPSGVYVVRVTGESFDTSRSVTVLR